MSSASPERHQGPGLRTRRAVQSCDACKNRKTKCVQTGTGQCRYCAAIGGTCTTSVRPQRRPYYRVSEEEYQCCIRLLRHFVGPDVTLDLKTMKAMIAEVQQGRDVSDGNSSPSSTSAAPVIETEESEVLKEELGCMIIDARGSYTYVGADSPVRFANAVAQATGQVKTNVSDRTPRRPDKDQAIMVPLVRSRLPPATPESIVSRCSRCQADKLTPEATMAHPTTGFGESGNPQARLEMHSSGTEFDSDVHKVYLPDRDTCQRYTMRFFDEIQSVYWFYSPEQFYMLLDKTYSDPSSCNNKASWLCSLYSIFAICSAGEEKDNYNKPRGDDIHDPRSSSEYLAMAKSLGVKVCDESDADAVRALSLMSLALHSSCFTVTAYLITGMAVRMAYSLGMHRNISASGNEGQTFQGSVSRARVHRLWWTIYLLDHEVAIQLGYPCAIVDSMVGIQTPPACESILDPGRPTPHGYQAACVALVKLRKKISYTLYVAPAYGLKTAVSGAGGTTKRGVVPFSAVTSCINDLRDWLAQLSPHLMWHTNGGTAPSQRRALAVLHLRYWTTLIYVQRPFLLYTVVKGQAVAELSDEKKRWYEELSALCLDAADKAVGIVKRMWDHGLLSSLVLFDSQCIQELVHVFLLGRKHYYMIVNSTDGAAGGYVYQNRRANAAVEGLETCMAAMRSMAAVGWCEKMLPELVAQIAASDAAIAAATSNGHSQHIREGESGDSGLQAPQVHGNSDIGDVSSPVGNSEGGVSMVLDQYMSRINGNGDALEGMFLDNFAGSECINFDVFDMLDFDMGTFETHEGMNYFL